MPLDTNLNILDESHLSDHNALHTLYNLWEGLEPSDFSAAGHTHHVPDSIHVQVSGALSVGALTIPWVVPYAATLTGFHCRVETAPVGADILLQLVVNGATEVWTTQANRPKIANGANSGAMVGPPNNPSLAAGDRVYFVVDQVGSSTAGSNLAASLVFTATSGED